MFDIQINFDTLFDMYCFSFCNIGFTGSVLKACCGGGDGRYNVQPNVRCGEKGSTTCEDPSTYANWDGIHLTEAAYRHIATGLISGRFTMPTYN